MLASECTTTLICINMEYTTTLKWWCIYAINNVVCHSIIIVVVHVDHLCGGAHRRNDGTNAWNECIDVATEGMHE